MAPLARSLGLGGINIRGILLAIIVVTLIVGLFFIPEIITAVRGKSVLDGSQRSLFSSLIARTGVERGGVDLTSPLDEVEETSATSVLDDTRFEELSHRVFAAKRPQVPDLFSKGLTWGSLKSRESLAALKRSQNDSLTLSKEIPVQFPESRFALYNLSSGIRSILTSGEKVYSAEEAFRYIERLDAAVTESMIKEGVPDQQFNRWITISLGPVFKHSRSVHQRERLSKPFNPDLRLEAVKVHQRAPTGTSRSYYPPMAFATFRLQAGAHKRVDVFQNGAFLYSRKLLGKDRQGRQRFTIHSNDARGIFTFRIVDASGQMFEKSYTLYGPARRFPWTSEFGGLYQIPFAPGDKRFDMMFAMGPGVIRGSPEFVQEANR